MAAFHFLDRCLHHGEMLVGRKRVQLTRARAGDDGADLLADEFAEVAAQPGEIEREIFFERCDGKRDDAAEAGAKLGGCEWHGGVSSYQLSVISYQ
jgi:hypothetical protein